MKRNNKTLYLYIVHQQQRTHIYVPPGGVEKKKRNKNRKTVEKDKQMMLVRMSIEMTPSLYSQTNE